MDRSVVLIARRWSVMALMAGAIVGVGVGCSTVTSSNAVVTAAHWDGPVFVSEATVPAGIEYKVIGSVQADGRGYGHVEELYPLLAAEARKIGANAVVSTKGGHHVTAMSWASPYVSGVAIRVDDLQKLKAMPGSYQAPK